MSAASVFFKPSTIRRAVEEDTDRALMQDALSLAACMVLSQTNAGGAVASVLQTAVLKMGERIQAQAGEGFQRAGERLYGLIEPLISLVRSQQQDGAQEDTGANIGNALALLSTAAEKIQGLEIGALRGPIAEVLSIIEQDLGFTASFLENQVQQVLDDISRGFEQAAQDAQDQERHNAQALAQLVRRIKRRVAGELRMPVMNADRIATAVMKLLRKYDIPRAMDAVRHSSAALAEVAQAVEAILALAPYTGQSTQSIGADRADPETPERDYCWYLSWLLGDRYAHRPMTSKLLHGFTSILNPSPADEIWAVDNERDFMRHYLFHRQQRLFNAEYTTRGEPAEEIELFTFDAEATAAAAATVAAHEAAQQALAQARAWVSGDADQDDYEEARDSTETALEQALEYMQEARDLAQTAHEKALESSRDGATAQSTAVRAESLVDNANASARNSIEKWLEAGRAEEDSGRSQMETAVEAVERLLEKARTAAERAGEASTAASQAFTKAVRAAADLTVAKDRAGTDTPDFASAAESAAQTIVEAAAEALTATEEAATQATLSFLAADRALEEADRANSRGQSAETAAEQAAEAVEAARDATQIDLVVASYEGTVAVFETAVEAVEQAAEAAEDAAKAALLARAAALAVIARPRYTYKHMEKDTLEDWAYHTSYGADLLEMVLHGLSMEDGDFLSNMLLVLYTAANAIVKGAAKRPIYQWLDWLVRLLAPAIGALPHIHTNATPGNAAFFWFLTYLSHALEAHIYHLAAYGLRDGLLSIFTLVNHDPDIEDNRPLNYRVVEGVTQLITVPFVFLWAKLTTDDRMRYNAENWRLYVLDWICVGLLAYAPLANTVGVLTGMAIARAWNIGAGSFFHLWGSQLWKTIIISMFSYFPAMYLVHENDTDEGTYNPNLPTSNANPAGDPNPWTNGYPPRDTSPYLLPFRGGPMQCVQGNQGIWSHGRDTEQIYAYDFGLDFDSEILASRGGIVVDFFDWVPNNTEPEWATAPTAPAGTATNQTTSQIWNFICIRHDVFVPEHDPTDIDPATGNQVQAVDPANGNPVFTYAIYGHGRLNGVRDAFGTNNPLNIIGQPVAQGDLIMFSDDTGISAYNHLHTHVRTSSVGLPANPVDGITANDWNLDPGTLPFVYRDARHRELYRVAQDDGVPRSMKYYRSENG